ncbi:HAMP domain-containing histidine kinase [Baekduia soli]|uniref:Signal transduction histidine-protein kinase/phosphatase MprB n=1 Tax=Baekduia soli TaxID=496014 RepID=A0A5B8UA34_9ACTN|nr:HAMP domain-containing sensor histidine kinase [Baekduia soli]QEC50069.1 HAMP domain-containing histidine kinase [Baekduia soli]
MSLRSRLLLALLATSAVTLGVAALALLSPLQHRLDAQGRDSVKASALATRPALATALVKERGVAYGEAIDVMQTFKQRTGTNLALYDPTGAEVYNLGLTQRDPATIFRVLATGRVQASTTRDGSGVAVPIPLTQTAEQLKAKPLPPDSDYFVLVVRKPDISGQAVGTVRSAFLTAAVIGLGVALLLGLVVSAGLSRRLGRLRRSALALAADGVGAPPPRDTGNDEVGDLARALASMQQGLRRQEEARRAFVATASHELRTPLTSLQGNLELLAEDLDHGDLDVDAARDQLRGAQGQLRRLSNLASELLDLSRLDAGVELRREPVELGELCRAVAAEFELRAREQAVDLQVAPPPGPVWAAGDPGAVARVARILIDNALRFSPAGGEIAVVAAYHGDQATLEVADQGPGVPETERTLIFERFQRGTRTGGAGGFGLGLAIGRELAERMGGALELAPADPGARFVLTLPIELPRGSGDGAGAADALDDDLGAVGDEASDASRR